MNEILPGVTAKDPFAPVHHSFNHEWSRSRELFLGAPGETGNTCTIAAAQAVLQFRGRRAISVATSAVAVSLLEGGRAAHSVFKISIPFSEDSVCSIPMDSKLADSICRAHLIIWDEIVICVRYCIEAVDKTLRTIMQLPNVPFGSKCILFSGDFRQILPVVP